MTTGAGREGWQRERARDAFLGLYGGGFVLGFVLRVTDAPRAVALPLVAIWGLAVAASGAVWLIRAVRDGALVRALPDYLYAALGLAVIALACAATALLVLLALGAEVTSERVTGWAAAGTFAVLVAYWLARAANALR